MDLFENFYLICIIMNTIYNVEYWGENQGKTIAIERFLVFLAIYDKFHSCQFGQRDHLNAMKYCLQQLSHLHDVKSYRFHAHQLCDSKEWDALTKIPIAYQ